MNLIELHLKAVSVKDLRRQIKQIHFELTHGEGAEKPKVELDEYGYEQPKPTVPHVYPVPTTSEGEVDTQAVHDKIEEAASPNGSSVPTMPSVPTVQSMPGLRIDNGSSTGANQPVSSSNERDSRGFPYDKRIHSESKAVNKDGSWRYRRNVDEGLVASVEAELRGTSGVPNSIPAQAAPMVQPAPVAPPIPAAAVQVQMPSFPQQPAAQPAAPVQPVAPVQNYDTPIVPPTETKPAHTFESFLQRFVPTMAELIAKKVIDQNYVQTLCTHFGVKEIWEVKQDVAKARELFDSFVQNGLITQVS